MIKKFIQFKFIPLIKVSINVQGHHFPTLFKIIVPQKTKDFLNKMGIAFKVDQNQLLTSYSNFNELKYKLKAAENDSFSFTFKVENLQFFNAIDIHEKPFCISIENNKSTTFLIDETFDTERDVNGIGELIISNKLLLDFITNKEHEEFSILLKPRIINCRFILSSNLTQNYKVIWKEKNIPIQKNKSQFFFEFNAPVKAFPFQSIGEEIKLYKKGKLVRNKLKSPTAQDLKYDSKGQSYWEVNI